MENGPKAMIDPKMMSNDAFFLDMFGSLNASKSAYIILGRAKLRGFDVVSVINENKREESINGSAVN